MKTIPYLKNIYVSIKQRRDVILELVLALASSIVVESVVGLSRSVLFRRKHGSVYEGLNKAEIDEQTLLEANYELVKDQEQLEGYEVYSGDGTFIAREDAETLPEREQIKKDKQKGKQVGQRMYSMTRLCEVKTSWSAVMMTRRIGLEETESDVAVEMMTKLDKLSDKPKLVVFDAGHSYEVVKAQQELKSIDVIVRLKSHQAFYEQPDPTTRQRKHGKKLKLTAPHRPADEVVEMTYQKKIHKLSVWNNVHYYKAPNVQGKVIKVEVFSQDNKPLYNQPMFLFSTALNTPAAILVRAYLWRSAHEQTYRFMKQHLGLNVDKGTSLHGTQMWLLVVCMAMNVLLAIRHHVSASYDPWYPQAKLKPLSQRAVQKAALPLLLGVTSFIKPPQPAGFAPGRPLGFIPKPKPRHKPVRKTTPKPKTCPSCGVAV